MNVLETNPLFIYMLLAFLDSVTDKTVFTITVGKRLKASLLETPLARNKTVQHLLHLLINKDLSNIAAVDKRMYLNPALTEFFDTGVVCETQLFKDNLSFLLKSILSQIEFIPTPAQIFEFCADDQHFSSLMGNVIERILQGFLIRRKNEWILQSLFGEFL